MAIDKNLAASGAQFGFQNVQQGHVRFRGTLVEEGHASACTGWRRNGRFCLEWFRGEFFRSRRVSRCAIAVVHQSQPDAVLYLRLTEVMQVRPHAFDFAEKARMHLRHQDVPGIAAIHHPLREIDSRAGDVIATVDICDAKDRAAVQADAQTKVRTRPKRRHDLPGCAQRGSHIVAQEDQRHAVTCRNTDHRAAIAPTIELHRTS
jgi:hypothetical protein